MASEIEKLIVLAEKAPKFRPEFVVDRLRSLGRHVEADLIEAQRDYIEVLESRLKSHQPRRNRKRK